MLMSNFRTNVLDIQVVRVWFPFFAIFVSWLSSILLSCSSPDSGPFYEILNLADVALADTLRILARVLPVMHFKVSESIVKEEKSYDSWRSSLRALREKFACSIITIWLDYEGRENTGTDTPPILIKFSCHANMSSNELASSK